MVYRKGIILTLPPPLVKLTSPGWSPEDGDGRSWTPHETLTLYCANHGHSYVATLKCGKRSCVSCRQREYFRLWHGYLDPLRGRRDPDRVLRFLTLTIQNIASNNPEYLRKRVVFIRKAFNRLRRWKAYKKVIPAGLVGTELTNKSGESWNLHLHILYEGGYIPVCCQDMKDANTYDEISYVERMRCADCSSSRCMRRDWRKATGGAVVVDIRRVWSIAGGLAYIAKYMTKAADISGLAEVYDTALKGIRLLQPFGTWFGIRVKPHAFGCPECGCVSWFTDFQIEKMKERASPCSHSPPELIPF